MPAGLNTPSPPPSPDEIGIVTAFFDIGRGAWTEQMHLPSHVHRSTDTYMERFAHMASLENAMVIYTSPELVSRVMELRRGKEDRTQVIPFPLATMFEEKRAIIQRIQTDPVFAGRINPSQRGNPEYWSPDYIVVTNMKAVFTAHAIQNNLISNRQIAWMDFGYCRGKDALGGSQVWQYNFTPGKVHLFVFSEYKHEISIADVIANNIVYVAGAAVVAERHLWQEFAGLTVHAVTELLKLNLVDDDQTMFLLASLYKPDLFELHQIPDQEWQPVLRLYNKNVVPAK